MDDRKKHTYRFFQQRLVRGSGGNKLCIALQ